MSSLHTAFDLPSEQTHFIPVSVVDSVKEANHHESLDSLLSYWKQNNITDTNPYHGIIATRSLNYAAGNLDEARTEELRACLAIRKLLNKRANLAIRILLDKNLIDFDTTVERWDEDSNGANKGIQLALVHDSLASWLMDRAPPVSNAIYLKPANYVYFALRSQGGDFDERLATLLPALNQLDLLKSPVSDLQGASTNGEDGLDGVNNDLHFVQA